MKFVGDIKDKAGIVALNKELKSFKRESSIQNFESAVTAGFIFDADDREKYQQAKDFIAFTEKKEIRIFGVGYTAKSDQIAYFPYKNGVGYFGLDEINWYGKPTNPVVDDFLKRRYDLLLDLTQSDLFPVHYIFALSSAKFKITNNSIKAKYADFVLQLENSEKLATYIAQIKHYLESIKIK